MTTENPAKNQAPKPLKSTKIGVVTSDKRDKTRTVKVAFSGQHSKYGKILRGRTSFHVHDENNESHLGDKVEIVNCRPLSKTKSWRLVRILEKSAGGLEHVTPDQVVA